MDGKWQPTHEKVYFGDGTGATGLTESAYPPPISQSTHRAHHNPCVADFNGDQIDDVYVAQNVGQLNSSFLQAMAILLKNISILHTG